MVVGGGFGGLAAARGLARTPVRVTVIDRENHHLFQPLLYQVATAALAPADISEPIRSILSRQRNAEVRLGAVRAVDVAQRRVEFEDGAVSYDWLILATGARHAYFGHPEWEAHAPGLKTLGDALAIRQRLLTAYEAAEWCEDDDARARLLTFVVVGGGPTGVELAGAIADIAHRTLVRDFRRIRTAATRVVLVEALPQVLAPFPDPLPEKARRQLERLEVEVRLGQYVEGVDEGGVVVGGERIEAATVLWAAGNQASPLARTLGVPLDRSGRVFVEPDLSIPGHPEVMVIGDLAHFAHDLDEPLPAVAQVAMQGGRHAARNVRADLAARDRRPFRYRDYGTLATIGKRRAVGALFGAKLSGFVAWLVWVFVHILQLVGHRNRAVVLVKWAWAWFTDQSSSRVLWRSTPPPSVDPPDPSR